MEGKVVLVTGAGRGVGRGIALAHGAAPARRWSSTISASSLAATGERRLARRAGRRRDRRRGRPGGRQSRQRRRLGRRAARWSRPRSTGSAGSTRVVNNAGNLRDVLFHKMSPDDFDAVIAVHLKGSFNVSRAAAPHLQGAGQRRLCAHDLHHAG